jgi:hypothetical protein
LESSTVTFSHIDRGAFRHRALDVFVTRAPWVETVWIPGAGSTVPDGQKTINPTIVTTTRTASAASMAFTSGERLAGMRNLRRRPGLSA